MGIKLLNTFIKSKCKNPNSISKIHLKNLKGKKIAIDTSIYMYRYIGDDALIENFYSLCSLFYEYEIIPVFVFDGKPPEEKNEEIQTRKAEKKSAKEKYEKLEKEYNNTNDLVLKSDIKKKMDLLKNQFIKVTKKDTENVKLLIKYFGMSYIDSKGEADTTCALLELTGRVYAILSEDMDLFAYGCSKILRYFSLINHNCLLYNVPLILNDIGISKETLKLLCCVSGNDYLKSKHNIFLYYDAIIDNPNNIYQSLIEYDNTLTIDIIKKIENIYTINNTLYDKDEYISIDNNKPDILNLYSFIEKYGFIHI